jgi:hypothetical protein
MVVSRSQYSAATTSVPPPLVHQARSRSRSRSRACYVSDAAFSILESDGAHEQPGFACTAWTEIAKNASLRP